MREELGNTQQCDPKIYNKQPATVTTIKHTRKTQANYIAELTKHTRRVESSGMTKVRVTELKGTPIIRASSWSLTVQ